MRKLTRLKLGADSPYYNFGFETRENGMRMPTVDPYKLVDGDNIFNLEDAHQAVTYAWVSVHPKVASSLEAYNQGLYPSETQFYVKDEVAEQAAVYNKKKLYNDAIIKFNNFSPDKKKKIARLCDLPAFDDTREELVYNMVDDFLNSKELPTGAFKGKPGITIFNLYCDLDDNSLYIKDLIEQAFKNGIYRIKRNSGGKVYEGEQEVYKSKDDCIDALLLDKDNQDKVLGLEKKLKMKKLASV